MRGKKKRIEEEDEERELFGLVRAWHEGQVVAVGLHKVVNGQSACYLLLLLILAQVYANNLHHFGSYLNAY